MTFWSIRLRRRGALALMALLQRRGLEPSLRQRGPFWIIRVTL